jgi:hypothetical protein
LIPGGGIKRVVYKPQRIEVFFMFNWLFGKKPCPKEMRLMAKKLKMDQLFHMRPWSSMDVERDLLKEMGAFREEAVKETDFYEPMEELLETLFVGKGELHG